MNIRKLMDIVSDKPVLKESTIVECPMMPAAQPNNDFVSMNISVQAQGIANIRDALQLIHNVENHGQEAVKPMDMPTPGLGIIAKPDDSIDRIKGLAGLDVEIEPEAKDEEEVDETAYDRWKTSEPEYDGPEYWCGHGEREVEIEVPAPYNITNYPESDEIHAGESMLVTAHVNCEGEDFKINAIDYGNEAGEAIDLARAGQKWLDNIHGDISPKLETDYDSSEHDFDEEAMYDFDQKDDELDEILKLANVKQTEEEFENSVNKDKEIKFSHKTLSNFDKRAAQKQYGNLGDTGMSPKPVKPVKPVKMEDAIRHDLMNLYKSIRENK